MGLMNFAKNAMRKIRGGVTDMTGGQAGVTNDEFYKFITELWEEAKNKENEVKRAEKYWSGELENHLTMTTIFKDQKYSNDNIIQPIVETKISNLLDAQFEIAIVPEIGSFYDMNAIKDSQAVADIFNDEIKNIDKANQADVIDEMVVRDGENTGIGSSQVEWSTKNRPEGEVIITNIPARDIRWIDNVLVAFRKEYSVQEVKELYCKDENGNYVPELCDEIDQVSEIKIGNKDRRLTGSIISYQDSQNGEAGQAFATKGNIGGIQAGKVVNLVTMYLLDDSCYAPEENDDSVRSEMKSTFTKMYPNGRKVVFNLSASEKLILADEPLPESFRNLGNVDVYNPIIKNGLAGESPIKILYPIQDRIDGLYTKYRLKVQWDVDTQLVDEDFGIEDSALVNGPITKVKDFKDRKGQMSEPLTNDGILKGEKILEAIEKLKQSAYEKAGVNQTMLSGYRQTGTTSAEQVEALQESPMVKIRRQQRNFINYKIARAEKCLLFIMQNYSDQRFIQLSTGIDGAKIAQIKVDPQTNQKSIALLQEVQGIVKEIKSIPFNQKWKLKVECSAGTAVPRSRKELADLTDKLAASPIMASGDLDMIEMLLDANDYPKKRAVMSMLRAKQEAAQQPQAKVEAAQKGLLANPAMGQAFAAIFKSLTGYSAAQGAILRSFGLNGQTDTIIDAPAQSVTAKTNAEDIAAIVPGVISRNPTQAAFGNKTAVDIKNAEHQKGQAPTEIL